MLLARINPVTPGYPGICGIELFAKQQKYAVLLREGVQKKGKSSVRLTEKVDTPRTFGSVNPKHSTLSKIFFRIQFGDRAN